MLVTLFLLCLGAHAVTVIQLGTLCLDSGGAALCSATACDVPGPSFPIKQCVNEPVVALPTSTVFASWMFVEMTGHLGFFDYGLALYPNVSCTGVPETGSYCPQGTCCDFSKFPTFEQFSLNGTKYRGFVAGIQYAPYSTPIIVGLVLGIGIPVICLILVAVCYFRRREGYAHVKQVDDDLM
jgi:hypothetical protein